MKKELKKGKETLILLNDPKLYFIQYITSPNLLNLIRQSAAYTMYILYIYCVLSFMHIFDVIIR